MSFASRVVPPRCVAISHANAATFSTKSSATSCKTCRAGGVGRRKRFGRARATAAAWNDAFMQRLTRWLSHLRRVVIKLHAWVDLLRKSLQAAWREVVRALRHNRSCVGPGGYGQTGRAKRRRAGRSVNVARWIRFGVRAHKPQVTQRSRASGSRWHCCPPPSEGGRRRRPSCRRLRGGRARAAA